jgi:hypothetical protein
MRAPRGRNYGSSARPPQVVYSVHEIAAMRGGRSGEPSFCGCRTVDSVATQAARKTASVRSGSCAFADCSWWVSTGAGNPRGR